MYKVSVNPLLEAENLIDELLSKENYLIVRQGEKEIRSTLSSIQDTIQNVLIQKINVESWSPDIPFPDFMRFDEHDFAQITWAAQSSWKAHNIALKTPNFPPEILSVMESIHKLINSVAENKIDIVELINAQPVLKAIFAESKDMNLGDASSSQIIRKLLLISRRIEELLEEFLPLDYLLDDIFEEFDEKTVTPPDMVLAPGEKVSRVLREVKFELYEVEAIRSVDGVEMSEDMRVNLRKLNDLINLIVE